MRAPKKKSTPSPAGQQPDQTGVLPVSQINLAPAAEAKLNEAGQSRAASAAEAGLPGWQSLGKGHKPTRANPSRQGPRERKVRW